MRLEIIAKKNVVRLPSGNGLAIGSAFFPHEIILEYDDKKIVLRGDYRMWLGTGFLKDALFLESNAPDATRILLDKNEGQNVFETRDGRTEVVYQATPA